MDKRKRIEELEKTARVALRELADIFAEVTGETYMSVRLKVRRDDSSRYTPSARPGEKVGYSYEAQFYGSALAITERQNFGFVLDVLTPESSRLAIQVGILEREAAEKMNAAALLRARAQELSGAAQLGGES